MLELTTPTFKHVEYLGKHLRSNDLDECVAGGFSPHDALLSGIQDSDEVWSVMLGDEVVGMLGSRVVNDIAYIWFLGTDRSVAKDTYLHWFRDAPDIIENLRCGCKITGAISINTNTVHHEWLKKLGYTQHADNHHEGYTYCTFYKEHPDV